MSIDAHTIPRCKLFALGSELGFHLTGGGETEDSFSLGGPQELVAAGKVLVVVGEPSSLR